MNHSEANAAAEGMGETIVILKRQRDELIAACKSARGALEYLQPVWESDILGAKVLVSLNAIDRAIKNATGE